MGAGPRPQPRRDAGSAAALAPSYWQDGSRTTASAEERRRHVEEAQASEAGENFAGARELPWHDEEVLILHEPPVRSVCALRGIIRAAMQLAMLLVVIHTAVAGWRSVAGTPKHATDAKADMSLPFHM